jgi:metallo-beta-lactamase family protein
MPNSIAEKLIMNITFIGAVQTVTGSMHILEVNGKRILLDCGLFQGKRKITFELNRNFPFDPSSIDMLILSHAHIDHSGNIPTLVQKGFNGKIFTTSATTDLCEIMLMDSAHIQEKDVEFVNKRREREGKNLFEPLYTQVDAMRAMDHFVPVPYEKSIEVCSGVDVTYHDAGHLLGSSVTTLDITENGSKKRLTFTGDLGRKGMPILKDPTAISYTDYLITESTYGDRIHSPEQDVKAHLVDLITKIALDKAKLIIPAFSVGRTQTIVYFLNQLYEEGKIPEIPVFVDSPLSTRATEVFSRHEDCFDAEIIKMMKNGIDPFAFRTLKYVGDVEESKRLNRMDGPMVIITASGMCESGRILHHLANSIENMNNIILIIGFQAENTLGRRLVDGEKVVKIFGDEYSVMASVEVIEALSAHADKNEFIEYFDNFKSKLEGVFVVHGEISQSEALAKTMESRYNCSAIVPSPGDTVQI